jgi:hypothetical protein
MKQAWKFLTSLRLTVVLLALGIVLVFVGTIAEADEGLYQAQTGYFKHWVVWGISFFGHHIPVVLPGGYLLGTALLINLVAAHIHRFHWTTRKLGIHLTHVGIILLLVGQLVTDIFSRETQIHFKEGETKNYSVAARAYELIFQSSLGGGTNEVVSFSEHKLGNSAKLSHARLPFKVVVKQFWHNSSMSFRAPMQQNGPALADNGIAQDFDFSPSPDVKTMDDKNIPTALVEIIGPNGSLGTWVVSGWAGDEAMVDAVKDSYAQQAGDQMASVIGQKLVAPQTVEAGGRTFTFTLRPERFYQPFSLTLLKATHSVYSGTDIPKDFRSRVRLVNLETGENREVEIYMNTPLRYGGMTFYQYQMSREEAALKPGEVPFSTLQIVRNPGWLTPYAGCAIVATGLVTQFMFHLVGFMRKRRGVAAAPVKQRQPVAGRPLAHVS